CASISNEVLGFSVARTACELRSHEAHESKTFPYLRVFVVYRRGKPAWALVLIQLQKFVGKARLTQPRHQISLHLACSHAPTLQVTRTHLQHARSAPHDNR